MDESNEAITRKRPPAKKKKRRRRKKSGRSRVFKFIFIAVIVCGFAALGAMLGIYMGIIGSAPAINVEDVVPESYTSIIYNSNGEEIDKLHGKENREYVKLEDIPKYLQEAVVAIEDQRFYEHNGIDPKGMVRALWINIKEFNFSQGASTITQQLIKNEILDSEKKLKRKLQEQYLAVKFEKELTKKLGSKEKAKDYILELYLNTISLNHGLNGVEAAAKFYYGKEVGELDLAECASIAGITKNPSAYSPLSKPEKNKERQTLVLDKMLELGYITQAEYDEAIAEDIYSRIVGTTSENGSTISTHNYFIDALIVSIADDLQEQKKMTRQQATNLIYSGGLQIYATVDDSMQSIMEESYKNDELFPPRTSTIEAVYTISIMDNATEEQTHIERKTTVNTANAQEEAEAFAKSVRDELLNNSNTMVADHLQLSDLQSAMVIMDYHNGEVKALVGGRGEKTGDLVFNRATQALRQPGSCFKVLAAYAPAIDLGVVQPGTTIMDEPFTYNGWTPKNWYSGYRGASTVRDGIRDSMNILAAKTIVEVGVDKAFDYLLNFGFTSLVDNEVRNGKVVTDRVPSASLGGITDGVSVLELTAAYGTIANGGEYNKPIFYTKILDHDGNVLLENTTQPKRVLKETTAFMLTDMMEDVITGGGTGGLARFNSVKMPIAGKTGTTTDDKDLTFAGYTPYYVAGIWLGYDQPKTISYKKSYHLLLWSDVMEKVHQNLEYKKFSMPEGIVTRSYCNVSGDIPISGLCENDYYGGGTHSDYCAVDSVPTQSCQVHKTFKIDKDTGLLATDVCPPDSVIEVVLAIDPESGEIMNMPDEIPEGKVKINIHENCVDHEEPPVIGEDDPIIAPPGQNTDPLAPLFPGENGSGSNHGSSGQPGDNSTQNGDSGNNNTLPPADNQMPETEPTDNSVIGGSEDDLYIPD